MLQRRIKYQWPQYPFRLRYETLRSLLDRNGVVLELLSDLEADLNYLSRHDFRVRRSLRRVFDETLLMAQELNLLASGRYVELYHLIGNLSSEVERIIRKEQGPSKQVLCASLDSDDSLDSALVGGKAAGVASLRRLFADSVPPGFTITTAAYRIFLDRNRLVERIRLLMSDLEVTTDRDRFRSRTQAIRDCIRSACVPREVGEAIRRYSKEVGSIASTRWAVRSSATSEDGRFSFAGQFDSLLGVGDEELEDAYRSVLASRFSDRAVTYRFHCGFREADTPMAVLFMPMVDAHISGVIYTADPEHPHSERMILNAAPGLGEGVVRGTVETATIYLSRESTPRIVERVPGPVWCSSVIDEAQQVLTELGGMAFKAAESCGHDMDIEWAVDKDNHIRLLQGRRLSLVTPDALKGGGKTKADIPLIEGGLTIFPGRAEGPVVRLAAGADPSRVQKGAVLVVEKPEPELSAALPRVAALLAVEGNAAGHLATLVREFGLPSMFQVGSAAWRLNPDTTISIDATNRKVYKGSRWPEVRERVLNRINSIDRHSRSGPLYDSVLAFTMVDPRSSNFKVRNCRSIHDIIRFVHEMAVRSMFVFGDEHRRFWKKSHRTRRLKTRLPLRMYIVDLDGSVPHGSSAIEPEAINSIPFRSLWRGITDSRLPWPERWDRLFSGLPDEFRETVLSGGRGFRRPGTANYAMIAKDYLNLNARFAYHYATVDAIIGPGDENNHVHFRFNGGGASDKNRVNRARFLEIVLRQSRFGVDRRGELVAAWLRRYPQPDSEAALELVGRLMVCARQLDMVLRSDADVRVCAESFLAGKYHVFG